MSLLDWIIVGGGVHGTYLSNVLRRAGVGSERLRVIDPHERPLEVFWRVTRATGMRYLRSPAVHHLDVHPYALKRFAKKSPGKRVARFVYPYDRPGLELFVAHAEHVVAEQHLDQLRERARATRLERTQGGYRVETDRGSLESRRVVLALGLSEQLCRPAWAPASSDRVAHLFEPTFDPRTLEGARSVAIVGGGISAAQLACVLVARGLEVTIVARHAPRVHRFDSDPAWLGPRAMEAFDATPEPARRRAYITEARHRGSMPQEVAVAITRERERGRLTWLEGEVLGLDEDRAGVTLALGEGSARLRVERVVLATGFEAHRPGGSLLDDAAVDRLGLPCAQCGYPIVSRQLAWAPGLFVTGPLAELELGPTARNIAGARAAGERIARVA